MVVKGSIQSRVLSKVEIFWCSRKPVGIFRDPNFRDIQVCRLKFTCILRQLEAFKPESSNWSWINGCVLWEESKKSPTGPTEPTPKPEYPIALVACLGIRC